MKTQSAVFFLSVWLASAPALAAPLSRTAAEQILAAAAADMEKTAFSRTFEESEAHLRSAIGRYRQLVQSGIHNGYLYYNLGNCHLRLRDVGESIYWLRMAERWIPRDSRLRANLRFARTQPRSKFPPPPASELVRTLLFFHFLIPLDTRLASFLLFWNLLWIALILGLYIPVFRRRWLFAFLGVASAVFGVSSGWDLYRDKVVEEGVILLDVVARKGAASLYDPAFTEPVSAGVEVNVLDKREKFTEVRFPGGAVGWIPSESVRVLSTRPAI